MGYRPAPKGLPQTSHGYTVDFSRWPQTDLVGSGSFKEFGELATSANATTRIEEGGYIRSVDDTNAQYIGINPNVVGGFNGQGQFSECLCYLDATATQTNYWLGPAVFIGADQQSGTTSGEHHYTLLLNDAGGGVSDWTLYRREVGFWNVLASANGEPDVAGKHFLLRLEAYILPDNSGVRLKCWKDGKLIIEVVDTNVDRLLGRSTVANHPDYGYPGVSWGNNGISDAARWVKWMRGGNLPELSEPLTSPAFLSTPARRVYFKTKIPWTRQPPPGTRIDNSNPLAKNLTRFVTFYMGGVGYDAFNNEQPIPAASYQGVIGTLEGTASSHPLTTGSSELEMVERPRYETGMQSSGFTFMSKARNKVNGALANQEFIAGMFGGGAGGNSWAWRLTVSGTPTFTIYTDGGSTNNSSADLPTGYDARDWHTFGGIMDYPTSTCYVDYTPDPTPSDLTGLTVDDHSAGAAMHIGAGGSATSSWNGEILYCATWKRALSQAEWDSMVANPWQIFEPREVIIGVGQSLTPVVESITTSGSNTPVEPAVLNYPAAGIEAGDLLIMVIGNDGSADLPDFPTGAWDNNKLLRATPSVGGFGMGVSWKIADGSENGGSENVGFSAGIEEWAGAIIHIKNWHGATPPQISSVSSQNSNDSMAVSLNPSWSSDDGTLWIWFLTGDGGLVNVSSWATIGDYFPDNQTAYTPGIAAPCAAIATSYEKIETKAKIAGNNDLEAFDPHGELIIAVRGAVEGGSSVVITDVANSGETPGAGSETWNDGSTGNVISGSGFV